MTRLFAGTPFDIPPTCDDCGNVESECTCHTADKIAAAERRQRESELLPPEQQTARISLQKRKGNRQVTVVEGLTARANDLPKLLAQLQSVCGAGGTVKEKVDTIELQGEHTEQVRHTLTQNGYQVK